MDLDLSNLSTTYDPYSAPAPQPAPAAAPAATPLQAGTSNIDDLIRQEGADKYAPVIRALYGQESGSGANAKTSVDGAQGGMQVLPKTFKAMLPDGDPNNPTHQIIAGIRYAKMLGDRTNGDPARMAAGYFSGPGNINAKGGTPFIHDAVDGNGKSVSSYVADVLGRIDKGDAPAAGAAPSQPPQWSAIAADPDFNRLSDDDQEQVRQNYLNKVVLPTVPTDQIGAVTELFNKRTAPSMVAGALRVAKDLGIDAASQVVGNVGGSLVRGVGSMMADPSNTEAELAQQPDQASQQAAKELKDRRESGVANTVGEWLKSRGQNAQAFGALMREQMSDKGQREAAKSAVEGSILKGEFHVNPDASAETYAHIFPGLLGSLADIVVGGAVAGPPGAMAVGAAQMSGQAQEAADAVTDQQLRDTPMYKGLVESGASTDSALSDTRALVTQAAGRSGEVMGAAGGGLLTDIFSKAGASWLLNHIKGTASRFAARTAAGSAEGSAFMVGQGVATNESMNQAAGSQLVDPGQGSAQNLALGAAMGPLAGMRELHGGAKPAPGDAIPAKDVIDNPPEGGAPRLEAPVVRPDWEVVDGQQQLGGPPGDQGGGPGIDPNAPRLPPPDASSRTIVANEAGDARVMSAAQVAELHNQWVEREIAAAQGQSTRQTARQQRAEMGLTDDVLQAQHRRDQSQEVTDVPSKEVAPKPEAPAPRVAEAPSGGAADESGRGQVSPVVADEHTSGGKPGAPQGAAAGSGEVVSDGAGRGEQAAPVAGDAAGEHPFVGSVVSFRYRGKTIRGRVASVDDNNRANVMLGEEPIGNAPGYRAGMQVPLTRLKKIGFSAFDLSMPEGKAVGADDAGAAHTVSTFRDTFPGADKLDVQLVRSEADVPDGAVRSNNTEAWYDRATGKVTVVLDAIGGKDEATRQRRLAEVLAHEVVGHHGMESLLMAKDPSGALLRRTLADVSRVLSDEVQPSDLGSDGQVKIGNPRYVSTEAVRLMYPDATPNEVAMETLARAAEMGIKPGLVDSLVTAVRQALRPLLNKLGIKLAFSRAEILSLVQAARKHVQERANKVLSKNQAAKVSEIQGDTQVASQRAPKDDKVAINLSAATDTIPGLKQARERANAGVPGAAEHLNAIAKNAIEHLTSGIKGVKIAFHDNKGLYFGELEPSLGMELSFPPESRGQVLAAMARFADNFNQQQIHVLQPAKEIEGTTHPDGSFNTVVRRIDLAKPLERSRVQQVIDESGLGGLNFSGKHIEAYYVGDPEKSDAITEFEHGFDRAVAAVGADGASTRRAVARLWRYGEPGDASDRGVIPYADIAGDVRPRQALASETAKRVAQQLHGQEVKPADTREITPEQRKLHKRIAADYEAMPQDDLANPLVRKAYAALGKEVKRQYDALPIKVEVYKGDGEPYANSQAMRQDVADHNHLFIYGTDKDSFGPPGVKYDNHPLLKASGRKDINGVPLLNNDLLRAVHDYFAHNVSDAQFGPKGEEAAWRNHMAMTNDPLARWALTSETRGQNSWVNFSGDRTGERGAGPLIERGFAEQKVGLLPIEHAMTGDASVDAGMRELERSLPAKDKQGSLGKTVESRGAKDREEYDAFNLDRDLTDKVKDKKPGLSKDDKIALQSELQAQQSGFNDMDLARQAAKDVQQISDDKIAAMGVHAEDAFPKLKFTKSKDGDEYEKWTAPLWIQGHPDEGQIIQRMGKKSWNAAPPTLLGAGHALSLLGLETVKAGQAYIQRIAASVELFRRGYDLLSSVDSKAVTRLTKAWRQIAANRGAFEFSGRMSQAEGSTTLEVMNDVGEQLLLGTGYRLNVERAGSHHFEVTIRDLKGVTHEASLEHRGAGAHANFVVHAAGLDRGTGAGKVLYQFAQAVADEYHMKILPDPNGLTGVNTYRRTEQMFSGAARLGKSGPMQPGVGQRIYGWDSKATTAKAHEANFARLALAIKRNVGELVPEFRAGDIHYDPTKDVFTQDGKDAEPLVKEILARPDVRAASVSRSTLARAAITADALEGNMPIKAREPLKRPVLYSKGAAEREAPPTKRSIADFVKRAWNMKSHDQTGAVIADQAPHAAYLMGEKSLGARQPWVITRDVVNHIRTRHADDGVTEAMLSNLPDLLNRPRAVIYTEDGVSVLLPARDAKGAPMLAHFKRETLSNGDRQMKLVRMASVYPKENSASYLASAMKDGSRMWLPSGELSRARALLQEGPDAHQPGDQPGLSQPESSSPPVQAAQRTPKTTDASVLSDEALRKFREGEKDWAKAVENISVPNDAPARLRGVNFSKGAGEREADYSSGPLDWIMKKAGGSLVRDWVTNPVFDLASKLVDKVVPERVKMGLVSDFGLDRPYLDARLDRDIGIHKELRRATKTLDGLADLSRDESRVAYLWMQQEPNTKLEAELLAKLPEASRLRLQQMRSTIDNLGREAVAAGLLTQDSYARNKLAYLHRSYAEHEALKARAGSVSSRQAATVRADTYKGRGIRDDVAQEKLIQHVDEIKAGDKLLRVERRDSTGRVNKVEYIRPDDKVPIGFTPEHIWEARWLGGPSATKVGLWRDLTPEERQRLGEIDEVRFAFAKTVLGATRDIENQKFLGWIADTYGKDTVPEDKIASGADTYLSSKAYKLDEFVKVPDTTIAKTGGLKKYGRAAGKYVPAVVWNDMRNRMAVPESELAQWWHSLTRAWKISKTALSPAVHMNNVMSNVIMADMADLGAHHILSSLKTLVDAHRGKAEAQALLERYEDSGAELGSMAARELNLRFIEPLLAELEAKQADELGMTRLSQIINMAAHGRISEAFTALGARKEVRLAALPFKKMVQVYQAEDGVFRLAKFLREVEAGRSDKDAGTAAREAFLDYNINAPWVQTLRKTGLPFVAFSYRAIPLVVNALRGKPWKIAKYMATAAALNAMFYAMLGMSKEDADKERKRNLPPELQGSTWGVFPRAMRMPWNDKNGQPVFLDTRRWVPAADVFDLQGNHSALPIPGWLQAAGPLALFGELMLNKSSFTGQPIILDTDTPAEATAKVADYLFKWMAPNLPLPGPGYLIPGTDSGQMQTYSWQSMMNAGKGKTDPFGREQSLPQAMASSIGVKVKTYPEDTARLRLVQKLSSDTSEIQRNMSSIARQYGTNGIDKEEFDSRMKRQTDKLEKATKEAKEALD